MNVVDPTLAAADNAAIEAISSSHGLALVPADRLREHYLGVLASHDAERRRDLQRQRGQWSLVLGLGVTVLALAGALAMAMPLKRMEPVFVHMNSDGSFTSTIYQSDVPQSLRRAVIAATLWQYVRSREGFATASHRTDQGIVYMMSDKDTADTYEASVNSKNPRSPARVYGNRTVVRLERVSETVRCTAAGACGPTDADVYEVRYRRFEKTEGQAERSTPHVSEVRFSTASSVPAWHRVTYNPLGLLVSEYRTTAEGAQ